MGGGAWLKAPTWLVSCVILGAVALVVHGVALLTGHVASNIDLRTHYQWAWKSQSAC